MYINLLAVAWVVGVCLAQQWRSLPNWPTVVASAVAALLLFLVGVCLWRFWRQPRLALIALLLCICLLAMCWVAWQARSRLDDRLALVEDNKVTRVIVTVSDLPTDASNGVRFTGELLAPVPQGLPKRVMVFWSGACTRDCAHVVKPGQRWRMALRFRYPRTRLNFAGLDAESWMFQQGLRASATVRGTPRRLADAAGWQPGVWIEQVRAHIRVRLQRMLLNERELSVMIALAIGDQQGVSREDWEVFNLTGITHLVSISGSHVTLIAALGGSLVATLYRRMRWRGRPMVERLPTRLVFVWAAGILAFLYCLLAGWGVPAQRTFFMLAAAAVGLSGRVPLTGLQTVLAAASAMTLLDPWAVLSTGFWLSFGAMLILIVLAEQALANQPVDGSRWQVLKTSCLVAAQLQWIMTLAITPVTIYLFQQVSLIGLLANAWAIPWITFVATPAALLVSALTLVPIPDEPLSWFAWMAHQSLYFSLAPVRWLASFKWLSVETAAIGVWELALGLAGVAMALMMPPWRGRWLAWLLLLPGVVCTPPTPALGQWRLTAFDVGQGGAVLVQTKNQTLLFDTGWRYDDINAVDRVLLPELRAMGIKYLDRVVVSHPDMDHVGGLQRLEQVRSIGHLMGSGLQRADVTACRMGQTWQVDGVEFSFLHPDTDCSERSLQGRARNQCSCVLSVDGEHHRALLTGDIDTHVEQQLIKQQMVKQQMVKQQVGKGIGAPYDVVMVAHHGSATSSSPDWIRSVNAKHAVMQAGHYNRFGHPDKDVVSAWRQDGARVWVSNWHGAVQFDSTAQGLKYRYTRDERKRYWHEPIVQTTR